MTLWAINGLMHCSKSDLLVRRHSWDPLNLAFRLPHVLAVATDVCAHRQRTFALHCFRFCFLLASGSPESHTFFSSATTRRSKCSRGLVLIASSKSINICQMRAIQVSRLVNWVFSFIMCSMFDLLPRGHPPDRNHGIRKPTFLRLFQCRVSMASAMPWPPPMHSVTMPRLRPSRRIEWISLVVSTAPVAPIG
jgi:hypothetical protein